MKSLKGPVLNRDVGNPARAWYDNLPVAEDPDYLVFMDDFTGIAHDQTNDWTVVIDTGSTAAIAADALGGRILLLPDGVQDNEGASIQGNEIWGVTVPESSLGPSILIDDAPPLQPLKSIAGVSRLFTLTSITNSPRSIFRPAFIPIMYS